MIMKFFWFLLLLWGLASPLQAQQVPNQAEKITYLVTFGPQAHGGWGDDDHTQIFFFTVPKSHKAPVFLRVYDPDAGGAVDEPNGIFNTITNFSIYGGQGAFSNKEARNIEPGQGAFSGTLLSSKSFASDEKFDEKWYTFGPFNPQQGEESPETKGYVFKVVARGVEGDDGNLYKYFLSTKPDLNKAVDGANAFTYEYSFRLPTDPGMVAHLYPFVDDNVVSLKQNNFDFDKDGEIVLYSVAKNREPAKSSGDSFWESSLHKISPDEQNTTVDFQIVKKTASRNDMVIYITNQYNQPVPFFAIPIGGPPKYKYQVNVSYSKR